MSAHRVRARRRAAARRAPVHRDLAPAQAPDRLPEQPADGDDDQDFDPVTHAVVHRASLDAMPGLYAAEMHRRVRLPADDVWTHLEDTTAYRRWWPWLQLFDATGGLTTGATWRAGIRAPLPYVVAFTLELRTVDATDHVVEADVTGDVAGNATIDVGPDGDSASASDLRMTWRLTPASSFLKLLDATARPVARWGHDTVMRRSVDAFVAAVEQTPPPWRSTSR
jgi:uncharacterized protein YndB with AHSA1/START domain